MTIFRHIQTQYQALPRAIRWAFYGVFFLCCLLSAATFLFAPTQRGLTGRYYANIEWKGHPLVISVDSSLTSDTVNAFRQKIARNAFSIAWSGYIEIPADGEYMFSTASDDGSWLFLDETLVVDNGGAHGLVHKSGSMALTKGLHKIVIRYVQHGGTAALRTSWQQKQHEPVALHHATLLPDTLNPRWLRLYPIVCVAQRASAWLLLAFGFGLLGWFGRRFSQQLPSIKERLHIRKIPRRLVSMARAYGARHAVDIGVGALASLAFFLLFSLTYTRVPPEYDGYFYPEKQAGLVISDHRLAVTQAFLAIICAYFSLTLFNYLNTHSFYAIFWQKQRKIFWIYFLSASFVFLLWLLGQWPGAMTPDSFWSWDQTLSLNFDDWHPYMYTVYLLMLRHFYDSPATVAIFQILLTAGIGSYIFYFCIKQGLRWGYTLPFFLLFITSLPISLFNITLWKDIPHSLFLVLTAFWLFRIQFTKTTTGHPYHIYHYFPLALLFIGVCQFRANGLIFYGLLPLLLFRRISWHNFMRVVIILGVIFYLFHIFIPTSYKITSDYYEQNFSWQIQPVAAIMMNRSPYNNANITHLPYPSLMIEQNYYSENYDLDKKIMNIVNDWDVIQTYFDSCWGDALHVIREGPHTPEEYQAFQDLFLRLSRDNLHVFLGTKLTAFLGTYFAPRIETWNNLLELRQSFKRDLVHFSPKSKRLHQWQNAIILWSHQFSGLFSERVWVWNLIVPTLIIGLILLFNTSCLAMRLYAWCIAAYLGTVFLFIPMPGFRYYYALYLGAMFAMPLQLLCLLKRGKRWYKCND